MSGELIRRFMRHKGTGEVFAVELVQHLTGKIVAFAPVDPTIECAHRLKTAALDADDEKGLKALERDRNAGELSVIDLPCRDASHWLTDIGEAFKEREEARIAWMQAHSHAKALKETLDLKEARVMMLVGDATNPKPLPLFDKPAA